MSRLVCLCMRTLAPLRVFGITRRRYLMGRRERGCTYIAARVELSKIVSTRILIKSSLFLLFSQILKPSLYTIPGCYKYNFTASQGTRLHALLRLTRTYHSSYGSPFPSFGRTHRGSERLRHRVALSGLSLPRLVFIEWRAVMRFRSSK